MRRAFLLPLVLLAFLVAGCGGGDTTSATGGGSKPAGAARVGADVLAFVSIDSDLQSGQWQQLDELSKKFPGRDEALARVERSLTKGQLDWQRDVEPALGSEFDVAVAGADASDVVGLTKPDDPAKFKALVDKANANDPGGTAVTRDLGDGWWGVADKADMFTRVLKGDSGTSLSDAAPFGQAMDKLPGEALAKAYVDGKQLAVVMKSRAAKSSGFDTSSFGLDSLDYAAASASAEDDGIRIHGATSGGPAGGGEAKLLDGVPADAFALLDFLGQGTSEGLDKLRSSPQFGRVLDELKKELGVTPDELAALLGGEAAFYVRPSALIPEFTLVLDAKDSSASLATLNKLAEHLAADYGGHVTSATQDGRAMKTLDLGRFSIRYGSTEEGKIVVTTGANGIADYGSGSSLPDSADFKEAKDAAGMPDSTGSVTYIDVKNLLPLLEGLASLGGESLPPRVVDNLRPLRSFLAWSDGGSGARSFDAFLEIK
jgi:hypothetical protein